MPSIDPEARKLCRRFRALSRGGRTMIEHMNDCMTVRNRLIALGEVEFVDKLLNVDWKLSYLRPMLARTPIDHIVVVLRDGCSHHHHDRHHQIPCRYVSRDSF
jgi:hypothetical protein